MPVNEKDMAFSQFFFQLQFLFDNCVRK